MITIVNYGMGNLRSIQYKLEREGIDTQITDDPHELAKASLLILPGVGHFAKAMNNLKEQGLIDVLNRKVLEDKTPIMGICLGIQLFTKFSEEGNVHGLGWINAVTKKFEFSRNGFNLKIPNIGWYSLHIKNNCSFFKGIPDSQKYYFVHSYHLCCEEQKDILATTKYGYEYCAAIWHENIFGVQFHPEKSHRLGFQLILNFIREHLAYG